MMLGFTLSLAAMKLALPGPSIHLLLLSSFAALEEKTLSFSAALCQARAWLVLHPGVLTACFLCKPPTLPMMEVAVSDTKWSASPVPVALLCSQSLSPHEPFPWIMSESV